MHYLYRVFKFAIGGVFCLLVFPMILEGGVSLGVKLISQKCPSRAFDGQSEIFQQIKREQKHLCSLTTSGDKYRQLDLAALTPFDWDTVYFSMP